MGDMVTITLIVLLGFVIWMVLVWLSHLRWVRQHRRDREEIRKEYGFSEWWGRR